MCRYDVIHKTGSTQLIITQPEEDRVTAKVTSAKNFVMIGRVVRKI